MIKRMGKFDWCAVIEKQWCNLWKRQNVLSLQEVCVRVNGKQSKPFHVGVGLRQGCVLSPLLFIVYMNWIDKCSQADECAMIGNCKISRLLFADDLVLLSFTESGLQRALNSFADAYNTAGMKISTAKTEVLHLSRNPDQ